MNDDKLVLIIDSGSLFTKYGITSTKESINEISDSEGLLLPSSFKDGKLESPTYAKRHEIYDDNIYEFPIREGKIQNFPKYVELLNQLINQFVNYPSISNVVITEPEISSGGNREMLTEIMFEQFGFQNVFLARKPVCAMYEGITNSSDLSDTEKPLNFTGIVIHSGDSYTSATPVYDGYTLVHPYLHKNTPPVKCKIKTKFSYDEFVFYKNASLVPVGGFNLLYPIIEAIKTNDDGNLNEFEYVKWFESAQLENERSPFNFNENSRPDITVKYLSSSARLKSRQINEVMFFDYNDVVESNRKCSIEKIFQNSVDGIDDSLKSQLKQNIVLSGGNTSHFGFAQRIQKLYPKSKVIEPKDLANFVIWNGAKKMVKNPNFSSRWATRAEYMENGPSIGEMKFF